VRASKRGRARQIDMTGIVYVKNLF